MFAYALPAFVIALPTIPVYIHLPSLYGLQLGVGLATTGYILLIARLFDTITDPLVGFLCDRLAFWGLRRKPWIALGAPIAGYGLYKILNPTEGVTGNYLLVWSLVLYGGWTMIAVPYFAWGAELSSDYHERTRITAWRESFGLMGIIGAGVLGAVTISFGWLESESIGAIAWAAIALGVIVIPFLLTAVPERIEPTNRDCAGGNLKFFENLQALGGNKPFLRLLMAWFLNGVANGIPAALFFIYLEHGLRAVEDVRPFFILLYFCAAIISIPLWLRFSKFLGKHRAWCWGMIAASMAFICVPWIEPGNYGVFGVVCVVTGMAFGADLILPPAIQADVTDYARLRTGCPQTGLQFALWGMSTKLALAVAVGIALPGIETAGFDPNVPSEDGRQALLMIYALIPVVIKVMAVLIVWQFPLTAHVQAVIRKRLNGRKMAMTE
jgi:GPH family glycoside/pentoside/hexuronide:cation symporter